MSIAPELEESPLFGGITTLQVAGTRPDMEVWPEDRLYSAAPNARQAAQMKLIPYFLWNNRGLGEMLVWMNAR